MEELRHTTILFLGTFYGELAVYRAAILEAVNRVIRRMPGSEFDLAAIQQNLSVADDSGPDGKRLIGHIGQVARKLVRCDGPQGRREQCIRVCVDGQDETACDDESLKFHDASFNKIAGVGLIQNSVTFLLSHPAEPRCVPPYSHSEFCLT